MNTELPQLAKVACISPYDQGTGKSDHHQSENELTGKEDVERSGKWVL